MVTTRKRHKKRNPRKTRGGVLGYGYKSELQNYLDYIKNWIGWKWDATTRWPGNVSKMTGLTPMPNAFKGRSNVIIPTPGNVIPTLTNETIGTTVYEYMRGNPRKWIAIGKWDVRNVTNMDKLFAFYPAFNEDISGWKTDQVTHMNSMFEDCTNFNQPLNWNTENVMYMGSMFQNCTNFNQPLNWNTENVMYMGSLFQNCTNFNQPLNWNTANVIRMDRMFSNCTNFNQPLSWTTTNVTHMNSLFSNCTKFNQPLNTWNTDKVTDVDQMFSNCTMFRQDLRLWKLPALMELLLELTPLDRFGGRIPLVEFKTTEQLRIKYLLDSLSTMFLNCPMEKALLPPLIRLYKDRLYDKISYGSKMNLVADIYEELYPKPSMSTRVGDMIKLKAARVGDSIKTRVARVGDMFKSKTTRVRNYLNPQPTEEFYDALAEEDFHDAVGAGRNSKKRYRRMRN